MSRRPKDDGGSLDLLLDTICNTFGGVLFVSILVVLLLNMSSQEASDMPPADAAQAQLVEAQIQLAKTSTELDQLMTAMQAQSEIAKQIVDPDLSELVQTCGKLQHGIATRTDQKVKSVQRIAADQTTINETSEQIKQHQDALENAQQNVAALQRQLQQEIESRTQAAKLPKGRATTKTEIPMFLKAGRLNTYLRRGPGGLEENMDEIVRKQDEQNRAYIEPKPGTGIVVPLDGDNQNLDERLDNFNPDSHYLAIFVWPDSFPHFAVLKDRMVVKEFEYRLIPFSGEQKIFFGADQAPVEVQ